MSRISSIPISARRWLMSWVAPTVPCPITSRSILRPRDATPRRINPASSALAMLRCFFRTARRRISCAGTPFVKVARAWWDSHGENFETHLELVTELDHVMSTLLDDLESRGLLEHTLVITLSEMGRTPSINQGLGRDHWASAWSASLSG